MLNKIDTAKNSDGETRAPVVSSPIITDSLVQLASQSSRKNLENSTINKAVYAFKRLSLRTKATMLAIAIGTVPVLGIGALAYTFANQSITKQITQSQETEAIALADEMNRFMFERYGDIQLLSNHPMLVNPKVRETTTLAEKQAVLNSLIETYKAYNSIAVFDLNGNPILQSKGDPLPNHSDRDYFQAVLKADGPYISQPQPSKSSKTFSIYVAAPVKDANTGETIAVIRARIPVKSLEQVIQNYEGSVYEYHLVDGSGKFFLASEVNQVGRNAKADFENLAQQQALKKVGSFVTVDKIDNVQQLVSYVPAKTLTGLPNLKWEVIVASDVATVFAPQRELLVTIALGTTVTALLVGAIAAMIAKRATRPILNATQAVEELGKGKLDTRLELEGEDELADLGSNINHMAEQLQSLLRKQELDTERAKLFTEITLRTRASLKTEDILNTAVREVRQALKTDRVIIYGFDQNSWDGSVLAESVANGWPKMMGVTIDDPCFRERCVEMYKNGRVRAITNIYQEPSLKNAACYINMLGQFEVKGNLIAPIIRENDLVGLVIAHHCQSPRMWEQTEIDLFKQVATQVGYALDQANLLEQVEKARQTAEIVSEEQRQEKEALQLQLLELLNDIEGASDGDLTVRAEVTVGEIGTVADFFNSIVESLRGIVTQVKESALQVNQSIGENEDAIRELADEALKQAAEINRSLDSVDQMTRSIQAVAQSAQQAALVAHKASRTAEKSGEAMDLTVQNILNLRATVGETAKKVKRLGESSQQISRVVSLINQIALQTNLLAINAGIEAARAGEEGQGFAVVAEEVGELAARSAAATQEIEQIVENIQRETSEVVKAMELGTTQVVEGTRIVEDAKMSLGEILDVSRQIDELVHSISEATVSQVETSQAVTKLMKDIAQVSQRTSTSSLKVSQSLQETVEISNELQATVGTFKVS